MSLKMVLTHSMCVHVLNYFSPLAIGNLFQCCKSMTRSWSTTSIWIFRLFIDSKFNLSYRLLLGASMESASHWTLSRTAASVWRVTAGRCVTSRASSSTPADACPANTAAARSRTRGTPTVTAKVATLESSVTQVGSLGQTENFKTKVFIVIALTPVLPFSRVWVSRGACARLLPGTARVRHLPDNAHGLLGGVHRRLRHGGLLHQPEDEAPEIHLRMQRWNLLQRGGGEDHQVRLRGLHVAPFARISPAAAAEQKIEREKGRKGKKEGGKREDWRKAREGKKERKRERV